MSSCAGDASPFRCPTLQESIDQTIALLPVGDAWQSNDGGPRPFQLAAFEPAGFDATAFATDSDVGSILYRFWAAVGAFRNYLESRLCDLRLEFWCATHKETHDLWMREYGLPDPCDPFPDLCTKVAAIGGARCEYFNAIVSRVGWTIDCDDGTAACGGVMGNAQMGCSQMGASRANTLEITVHLNESPAYTSGVQTPPLMGLMQMGMPITCGPDIGPLRCLIDRLAPAHVTINYKLVN